MLDALNPDKVCFIIYKARELRGAMEGFDDTGSNPTDDRFSAALTTANDEPVRAELRAYIRGLDVDESAELVALCWVGRGDFAKSDWGEALGAARDREGPKTVDYLLDMEALPDYLADGLDEFDLACDEFEDREF